MKLYFLIIMVFISACAANLKRAERPFFGSEARMLSDIHTLRGLGYIVVEGPGEKWASHVSILAKKSHGLRIDVLERLSDVVATVVADCEGGFLVMPLEGKRYAFKNNRLRLPEIGELPVFADDLADIIIGRPVGEKDSELEIDSKEKIVRGVTQYSGPDKKKILYEAHFDDFKTIAGRKFPNHIVIRFESPRLVMDLRYKEIRLNEELSDRFFKLE
ncbi:MAG: DUF4292 domain-containing protein [Deltaproteobacteria bacterium]|nr:DUF4292 domain-containing protein [Deltaproteobacteria bacterium]